MLSYTEITTMLAAAGDYFEVTETREDGWTHHYAGRDATAFLQRAPGHKHSHVVKNRAGVVVYERDIHGYVHAGNELQYYMNRLKRTEKKVGSRAVRGSLVGDAVRQGVGFWLKPWR